MDEEKTNLQNSESNSKQTSKNITKKIIVILVLLIVCLFAKSCTKDFLSSFSYGFYKTYPKNQKHIFGNQKLFDSFFIFEFMYANTYSLQSYCKDAEYIPYEYINAFKATFNKTDENAMEYIRNHMTQSSMTSILMSLKSSDLKSYEEEYLSIKKRLPDITRKNYCQLFDNEKDAILQEKVKLLKTEKPNMFLD